MTGFWSIPPSADLIRKELVRTRCLSCRHEVVCSLVPGLDGPIIFGLSCRQPIESADMRGPGKCGGLLRIVSARGLFFQTFRIGAESYDIRTDITIPHADT